MKEGKKPTSFPQLMQRLGRITRFYLKSPSGGTAKMLIALLFLLILCITALNVVNSYVGRYFMSAIETVDWDGFRRFALLYLGVFALQTAAGVFFRFTEERLGLHWREWLTHQVVHRYTDRRIYFHLEHQGMVTNPDQRISEDVRALTVSSLSFALMILNGTMTVISFSGVLWSISPKLFIVAVLYAAAGSALTILFGRPLVRLNYQQSDFEANFRSELIRVRDHAEGIALTGSEPVVRERLISRVEQLVGNFRRIIAVNRNVGFFTTGYNYLIQLIPTFLVAPLFMSQGVEFGVIGQSGMAFATLLGAFSLVVTQFTSISAYASVITRLGEFVDAADRAAEQSDASCIGCEMTSDHFNFSDLTLLSLNDEETVLLEKLNVAFLPGKCVLVTGPNDVARQALFRACAALHSAGTGVMVRPPANQIAFLPEQPYLPPTTLHDLLSRSNGSQRHADEEILAVLAELRLKGVLDKQGGLERACNWDDVLSLEERQLIAVARALLCAPAYVMMDRPESSLGPELQQSVLEALAKRGIGRVVFGRGRPDPSLHDACLELLDHGKWKWNVLR